MMHTYSLTHSLTYIDKAIEMCLFILYLTMKMLNCVCRNGGHRHALMKRRTTMTVKEEVRERRVRVRVRVRVRPLKIHFLAPCLEVLAEQHEAPRVVRVFRHARPTILRQEGAHSISQHWIRHAAKPLARNH